MLFTSRVFVAMFFLKNKQTKIPNNVLFLSLIWVHEILINQISIFVEKYKWFTAGRKFHEAILVSQSY